MLEQFMADSIAGILVTFKNAKEFHHDGIFYQSDLNRTTIIHVHGSFGNFYQNSFLRTMAKTFAEAKINFLAFNLRSHDGLAEGYRNEWDFEYAGGAIAPFEDCLVDIRAAVDFAQRYSDRIILQGHSMGCDRVLHFATTMRCDHDLILLSPCDSYRLQANWIAPETVEDQIERLLMKDPEDGHLDWLPPREYGIRQRDWDYPIHITRRALLSIMQGPPFRLVRMDRPAPFYLDQKVLIYIGGDDSLQTVDREVMFDYFVQRARSVTMVPYFVEADHSLWGSELEISEQIAQWVWT
jgi:pimeloyl-ACP methyl ester carboxylesterase